MAKVIIPFGKFVSQPWTAKYTYALISAGTQVPDDWYAADFDDTASLLGLPEDNVACYVLADDGSATGSSLNMISTGLSRNA